MFPRNRIVVWLIRRSPSRKLVSRVGGWRNITLDLMLLYLAELYVNTSWEDPSSSCHLLWHLTCNMSPIPEAPPILDFSCSSTPHLPWRWLNSTSSAFYGDDEEAKAKLVADVKKCCLHNGFFQIIGHKVPQDLQTKVFECSKSFFDQPPEEKNKVSKSKSDFNSHDQPPPHLHQNFKDN